MQELHGRIAVVTGGGSGIGRALAHAFAGEGMHVIVADIEPDAAETVASELRSRSQDVRALAVHTDVGDPASLQALAARAEHEFGHVNVLCNNAGVYIAGSLAEATREQWAWLLAVNLLGVIEGVRAFLPLLRRAGAGEAQIVNTASAAGLSASPDRGVYTTTKTWFQNRLGFPLAGVRSHLNAGFETICKYAVVGFSESLRADLAPEGIGVSVLCPGGVNTRIYESERNRPAQFGAPSSARQARTATLQQLEPAEVAALVVRGIRENRRYIHTDLALRPWIAQRGARIDADFAALEGMAVSGG
ncbi:MAG TPA: SDR family NAD(P)-dependent oxidoreductase [Dehalococcoidia bacterium]|nr:SDR family NAD(P)-dependent oxidoreductase [Dehalococcoidia bacterium]